MNAYIEENNGNMFLPIKVTKNNKCEELRNKIINLIRSITKNTGGYNENYTKIKFSSHNELLPVNRTIEIPTMLIVVRAIFLDNNKYHSQFLSREFLCKLWVLVFTVIS